MRVLIDIKHPAEANFFHPLLRHLQSRSDAVLVTAHYKAEVAEVLSALAIEHVKISEALPTPLGIVAAAAARTLRMIAVARRFRPQIMLARVGAEIGAAGRVLRIPAVSFDENEYATVQLLASRHLAHFVCTGMGYEKSLGRKQVHFNAVPQLAYTHPAWFTSDAARLKTNGFDPAEPYVVLRLSRWRALHDFGHRGISERDAFELAEKLSRHGRVIVSRSGGLPALLRSYGHVIPPDRMLDLLAFARLYVGEGGSMAAEAACLGTPAIWISPLKCGYLNVLARRYGLVEHITDLEDVHRRAQRWMTDPAMQQRARRARARLLAESENPVEFMVRMVDRYALRRRPRPSGAAATG